VILIQPSSCPLLATASSRAKARHLHRAPPKAARLVERLIVVPDVVEYGACLHAAPAAVPTTNLTGLMNHCPPLACYESRASAAAAAGDRGRMLREQALLNQARSGSSTGIVDIQSGLASQT
jgi:hypothetical protein